MKPILVIQHALPETLGLLGEVFAAAGRTVEQVNNRLQPLPSFDPADWSALVVMGGPMNVDETDRFPFLADECRWLRQAVAAELPVLGICLGAQLLAKSLGAEVRKNIVAGKHVKEIGWYDIHLTPAAESDPLFAGLRPTEQAFQWHGDTFAIPENAVLLATGTTCHNQAFRYGRNAYGMQFHWEANQATLDYWFNKPHLDEELCGLPEINPAEIVRQIPEQMPGVHCTARRVFERFVMLCADEGGGV
jgi:GMP synthase (glutamine-hydrolysing)